jgi:hypothetical protein
MDSTRNRAKQLAVARRRSHRGTTYIMVLGASLIVSTIGLGALLAARSQARSTGGLDDAAQARLYSLSAIEIGRLQIAADSNWRKNNPNGAWLNRRPIGNGSLTPNGDGLYTLEGQNPNGAMDRADSDPVILVGTGMKGAAIQKTRVQLDAVKTPLGCLNAALTVGSTIKFNDASVMAVNQTLASNATGSAVSASGASVGGNVEAVGSITGGSYSFAKTSGVRPRSMPDANVFQYYIANGTAISINSLPSSGGTSVRNVVLSPTSNPFPQPTGGPTDPQGIYVIDCQGQAITIRDCRIVGTLVLLNPGAGSTVQSSVNWNPAVSNYPCLLVQGNISLRFTTTNLIEGTGINFNPQGISPPATATPYPWGSSNADNDITDSYPSEINGLCYVSGDVSTSNSPTFDLLVVGGTLTCSNQLSFNYDSIYLNSPPPGFYTVLMVPASGTWQQAVTATTDVVAPSSVDGAPDAKSHDAVSGS